MPVVSELRYGALNSQRAADNLDRVNELVSRCPVLVIDDAVSTHYAEVRIRLKRLGKPIPENDVWIAAICLRYRLPLATDDAHFSVVDGLQVVGRG